MKAFVLTALLALLVLMCASGLAVAQSRATVDDGVGFARVYAGFGECIGCPQEPIWEPRRCQCCFSHDLGYYTTDDYKCTCCHPARKGTYAGWPDAIRETPAPKDGKAPREKETEVTPNPCRCRCRCLDNRGHEGTPLDIKSSFRGSIPLRPPCGDTKKDLSWFGAAAATILEAGETGNGDARVATAAADKPKPDKTPPDKSKPDRTPPEKQKPEKTCPDKPKDVNGDGKPDIYCA